MKIIISPAKNMVTDYTLDKGLSQPALLAKAKQLAARLKEFDIDKLQALLGCNDKLTLLNYQRYQSLDFNSSLTPAILAYSGLQYKNMGVNVFTDEELIYLNNHLRILSGFYGVLKPLDGIVNYRLEMQAQLTIGNSKNLYEFWNDSLYHELADNFIINLASDEYAKAIYPYLSSDVTFITVMFYELVNGKPKVKGTLAKMARGRMVRFMAENRVETLDELKDFSELGFKYDSQLSNENIIAFLKQ